jgi:hypothetical protein
VVLLHHWLYGSIHRCLFGSNLHCLWSQHFITKIMMGRHSRWENRKAAMLTGKQRVPDSNIDSTTGSNTYSHSFHPVSPSIYHLSVPPHPPKPQHPIQTSRPRPQPHSKPHLLNPPPLPRKNTPNLQPLPPNPLNLNLKLPTNTLTPHSRNKPPQLQLPLPPMSRTRHTFLEFLNIQ